MWFCSKLLLRATGIKVSASSLTFLHKLETLILNLEKRYFLRSFVVLTGSTNKIELASQFGCISKENAFVILKLQIVTAGTFFRVWFQGNIQVGLYQILFIIFLIPLSSNSTLSVFFVFLLYFFHSSNIYYSKLVIME